MSSTGQEEQIHRHSGWLIPALFFITLLLLSGLLLAWYLRPAPGSQIAPTGQSDTVRLSVHGNAFAIPANYIETAMARAGGEMDAVSLIALFPSWKGYSQQLARQFGGNASDSALIRLSLHGDSQSLDPRQRLDRIYRPQINGSAKGPFGLTQYGFAPDSGHDKDELYSGETGMGLVLFLCERDSPEASSLSCSAIDRPLASGLSYSYRFKRAYLGRWREIVSGVDALVARFRQP